MDGALLQLIATNIQDKPLTGKPEITPFKKLYRKYNPFAIMDHEVILPDLNFGSSFTSKFSQAGDLTSKVYLKLEIPEFLLSKKIVSKEEVLSYSDNLYLIKKEILERLSQIEEKVEYVLNDNTIRKFSPKSMGRFLNILLRNEINDDTKEYKLDYLDNYQTISYLLNSNLTNETMILGKYFLDYLQYHTEYGETLDSGNNILLKKYDEFLSDYIKNYYLRATFNSKSNFQIFDPINELDIFNQTIYYYLGNSISSDLGYIQNNILAKNQDLINLSKDILDFDFKYFTRFIHQLFPQDNFYSSYDYLKTIYPFFILQAYDPNLNNKIDFTITDSRFTLENYWVNNFQNLGEQSGFVSPISDITEKSLTNYRSILSKEFESLGYQKILGTKPLELWTILAAIQELWKWQIYYYEDEQTNFVPSYEFGSLPEKIRNFPAFLLGSWTATDNMLKNLRIDFSQRTTGVSDPKNIEDIISDLNEIFPTITKFNDSYSHLNRAGYDLNLLYLYTFYLFTNQLKISNIFKNDSSYQWINWMFQVVTNKLFSRWVSQYTVRISTDYLRVESVINTEAVSTVNLEAKIPFISIGDNEYILDTEIIKELIKNQTFKFNYLVNFLEDNDITSNNNYDLKTTKIYQNIQITVSNNQITWSFNTNNFYHHPNNKYFLTIGTNLISINLHYLESNNINFISSTNISDGIYQGDLTVNIQTNLPIISDISFNQISQLINDNNVATIKSNEIDRYNFTLIVRDDNDIIKDLLPIPSIWINPSNTMTTSNFNLPSEITSKYSQYNLEYSVIDNYDLPNLFSQTSQSDYLDCYNLNKGYKEFSFTDFSGANYNTYLDDLRQHSYLHQIPFGILSNNQIIIYHLPYKINSQILDSIDIKVSNFINNYQISTNNRIKNLMNYYEIIGGKVRTYSEGIDIFDVNLNINYFNNISVFEEEHLSTINNYLTQQYLSNNVDFQDIFNIMDKIQQEGINSFVNTLQQFSNVGYTYQKIIDTFINNNSNNITYNQLPFWKGKSFDNYYYWKSKIYFTDNGLYQSNNYFEDLSDIVITSDLDNLVNSYQMNKIYDESNLDFINNIGGFLSDQLNNIQINRDLFINFPKTANNETFNVSQGKTEYQIEKVLTDNELNKYIIETDINLSNYDYLQVDGKNISLLNDLGNNKYEISCQENLPVSLPQDSIEIDKNVEEYFKGNFYNYGIISNGLVILPPIDYTKQYILCNENFEELEIEYEEITDTFIKIVNQDLSETFTNFTDIIILKDEDNNYLPYGKIIPSFDGSSFYYRNKGKDSNSNIYLVGQYLLENPVIKDNVIIPNFDLSTHSTSISPIVQIKDFNYETYQTNIFVVNQTRIIVYQNFKIKPLDYIFIDNNWFQVSSISGSNCYLSNSVHTLTTGFRTNETIKIYRYISSVIPSIEMFLSYDSAGNKDYNYGNLTWNNHLFIYQKLLPLHIVKQDGITLELEEELEIGDILYDGENIYQINQKSNNEYQFYPVKIFDKIFCIKNYFNTEKIFDSNLYLNTLDVNIANNTEYYLRNTDEYEEQLGPTDPRYTHFSDIEINGFEINNIPRDRILHDYTDTIIQVYKDMDFSVNISDTQYFFGNDPGPRVFNWKGWIDWENNGLFNDSSANIAFEYSTSQINPKSPPYTLQSFNISIPTFARVGVTRMRIMLVTSSTVPITLQPNQSITQGIVVDLAIKISNLNITDNFNSIFNNQIIYTPLRLVPNLKFYVNTFEDNEWIYRQLKKGDLYFNYNQLELNIDNSTNYGWVIQPNYRFIEFNPTTLSGWFEINTNDSYEVNIGSIILDLSSVSITESYSLTETYQNTPIAIIDGKLGNLVHLNSIDGYTLSGLSGTKLIQQYPWKFKSPYNNSSILEKNNYKYLLNWDNTSTNLFDGDYSDNHIIYLEYPQFDLTSDNHIYFYGNIIGSTVSGGLTNQINGNKIEITSGINLSNYELIDFSEDLVIPLQEVIIDNVRTRVIELSGNILTLDKTISDFSKNTFMRIPDRVVKEQFINEKKTNPFINYLIQNQEEISVGILKTNSLKTQISNHYLEKTLIESIDEMKIILKITDNLISFITENSSSYSSGEAINDTLYINLNNLYLDNNYQLDETNKLLTISFFKYKKILLNNDIVLFEEVTKNNERFIHYAKTGVNYKNEIGISFLNNQSPYNRNSTFYLNRIIKTELHPDTFNLQRIGNTYYLSENLIWPEDSNVFITLRDNEIFDGQGYTISVGNQDGTGKHFGIFRTIGTNFSSAPIIKNLTIKSNVTENGGGFIRGYNVTEGIYPEYFIIENCKFYGNLTLNSGGFVGSYAGHNGKFRISGCYSEFEMDNTFFDGAGGIAGLFCAKNGEGLIEKSISKGDVYGGGIVGVYNAYSGYLRITNCYVLGDVKRWNPAGWGAEKSGGIAGRYAGGNDGEIIIDNSYVIGNIEYECGGICGDRVGIIEGSFSSSKVIVANCYCDGQVFGNVDSTTTSSNSTIYVNLSQAYQGYNETITLSLVDITSQIDTTSQIDYTDYLGIGVSVPSDLDVWDTTNIWSAGTDIAPDPDVYPKLINFSNLPYSSNYLYYSSEPTFSSSIITNEGTFNYINLESITYQNITYYQDSNLINLSGYKKLEFDIEDVIKVNSGEYYLDVDIKSDFSDLLPNLESIDLYFQPNLNNNYLTYYQNYLDKSGVLVSSEPFSQAKYQYYLQHNFNLNKLYPKFKQINNEITNYTDFEINKLLITQNNLLDNKTQDDYLLIPYQLTIEYISEFYKGKIEILDTSKNLYLNNDYNSFINDTSLKITNTQLNNNDYIIEFTSTTDLVNSSINIVQNVDLFYQIERDYLYKSEQTNLHQDLVHHHYEFQSFNEKNYLIQQILLIMDWMKFYQLNQSYVNNTPFNSSIIDISGNLYINENYLNVNDYQQLILLDLSSINSIEKTKHQKINLIINEIYCRLPNWILLNEFKNNPDDYLNTWLEDYQLSWDSNNNTFLDLSGNEYLNVKIPTNFEINTSNKLEYKISPDSNNTDIDDLFNKLDIINQDFSENNISDNNILYLSKLINFYDLWDIIKNYQIDLLPYLSSKSNLYEIIGNKLEITYQELNLFSTFEIIKDYSPSYIDKDLIVNQNFEYYLNLPNLPLDVSINQVDFLQDQAVFLDPQITEFYNNKQLNFNIEQFLPNQDGVIKGLINYQVLQQTNLGEKVQITTNLSLETDLSDNNAFFRYRFYNDNNLLDYQIINHNTFIVNNEIMENLSNLRFELDLPVYIRNNKFYLPENVTKFTQNDDIYWKYNNNYIELELSGNEIKNISHDNYLPSITLAKFTLISGFSNNYQYQYQLTLDKPLILSPYEFYQTTFEDFTIYDSSNNQISDYQIDLQESNKIMIYLNEQINLNKLVQTFTIGNTPEFLITSYNLDSSNNQIDIITEKEIDTSGYNHYYFHYFDTNEKELGNYLIKINGTDFSNNLLNENIYDSEGNYFGKFVDTSNGWIVTNQLFNLEQSYQIVIPSKQYFQTIDLSSDYLPTYFEFTFDDSSNKIDIDSINVDFNLPSQLPSFYNDTSILTGKIILRETNNLIYNTLIEYWKKELGELKEDYYKTQNNITYSDEEINWQDDLGRNIIEKASITIENQVIEEFDKNWLLLYKYYFTKEEHYRGLDKINNGLNLYIPLPFWFTQEYSNSFPIFLCQDSKINFRIQLSKLEKLINNTGIFNNKELIRASLCYETIWLSDEEKLLISSKSQEQLISVTNLSQTENIAKLNYDFYLKFRGAVKDFFFLFKMPSNKWNETYLQVDDFSKIDDFYRNYLTNKNNNSDLYQEMLDNKDTLLTDFSNVIIEFNNYEENFICYLIYHFVGSFKYDMGIPNENYVEACLRLYFTYNHHPITKKPIYPMGLSDMMINDRQLFTRKDLHFWSLINQTKYLNNGDLDKYGYSHAIYPLENQPSGHINYDSVKAMFRLGLNPQFYQELLNQYGYCTLKIYYRNYKLLKFMGNQVGILF